MAIVPDLSLVGGPVDKPLSTPRRNVTGNPHGVTTPAYTGELVQDTTTGQLWQAGNLTNTGWIAVTKVV